MDNDLKQHLEDLEKRFDARMEGRMDAMEDRINSRIDQMGERIEKAETNLLTAFHQWASPVEARQRSNTATMRTIDLELEDLRARVEKLENRP